MSAENRFNSRPTIGMMISYSEYAWHLAIQQGVKDAAKRLGVNLLLLVGSSRLDDKFYFEQQRSVVFDFADPRLLDGLIITTPAISISNAESVNVFVEKIKDKLPIVSIGEPLPGICSVLLDNAAGFCDMMEHLLEYHKYKRIAFIRGPEGNTDANERMIVYKTMLEKYGIPYDPALVLPGDFVARTGEIAVSILLDERKVPFDVILSSNDDMAWGAIEALRKRGIHVPNEVKVVGFDDLELIRCYSPPLTTVRQDIHRQGEIALETVYSMIKGEKLPEKVYSPSVLIVRESCGCKSAMHHRAFVDAAMNNIQNGAHMVETIKNEFITGMENILLENEEHFDSDSLDYLFEAFWREMNGEEPDAFLKAIQNLLEEKEKSQKGNVAEEVINVIRMLTIPYMPQRNELIKAENIWHQGRIFINSHIQRAFDYTDMKLEHETRLIRDSSEEVFTTLDIDGLAQILERILPGFSIEHCYVALYDGDTERRPASGNVRLIMAFQNGKLRTIDQNCSVFPAIQLLPDSYLESNGAYCFSVEPIYFGQTQLGYAIIGTQTHRSMIFTLLQRMFLNNALKAVVFIVQQQQQAQVLEETVEKRTKDLREANISLQKLYEERAAAENEVRRLNEELEKRVEERTRELATVNDELKMSLDVLKETQEKLIQSEKMAAMGTLVAGVAHEINTPVGVGVTAASHLAELTKDLRVLLQTNKLKKSDLENYISTSIESSVMVLSNLNRAHELIRSFKRIAVDQSTEEKRKFAVKEYFNEILLSLKPQLKKTHHEVILNCPDDLVIDSYPGAFSQIITNFIINSLIHAFNENQNGTISIEIKNPFGQLLLIYSDNGKGVEEKNLKKIFDPFFTTNRAKGGTGLGLHLVYNLVNKTLDGTIKCESKPGEGIKFIIIIPLQKPSD